MTYAKLADGAAAAVRAALAGEVEGVSVATSGTCGLPRDVLVGREALRASAEATLRRLSGPGRWLLAVPTDRIAGAQVLVRSALAGTIPVAVPGGPFEPLAFAVAARLLVRSTDAGVPLYASLVPTQLGRVLASAEATRALEPFAAILVGGATVASAGAPANVVETYGATETSGGCVYNGSPLDGVEVRVSDGGRIEVAGPVLADGYGDGNDDAFVHVDGTRWFVTSDLGVMRHGRLEVLGRADDVIVTGAHKVHPAVIERALLRIDGVERAVVVGVPDLEWGMRVVALVQGREGSRTPTTEEARASLARDLPRFALPREVRTVGRLPVLDSGKIDRRAARALGSGETEERGETP